MYGVSRYFVEDLLSIAQWCRRLEEGTMTNEEHQHRLQSLTEAYKVYWPRRGKNVSTTIANQLATFFTTFRCAAFH